MTNAIVAEGLVKRFGDTTALAGVDLAVRTGSVLGLLGPNGAGKTTAVRILATLLAPDQGRATVGGFDVVKQAHQVRRLIGLTGQYASVDETLNGTENLILIGRLIGLSRRDAKARARELLAQFGLSDAADKAARHYSGGMRRRLDLAASLVGRPELLYLDEPTTGLDPRARNDMYEIVRDLLRDGTTVLLTTQYLDEADQLADEIVVIDHGRVIASGTSEQLKARTGAQTLTVRPASEADLTVRMAGHGGGGVSGLGGATRPVVAGPGEGLRHDGVDHRKRRDPNRHGPDNGPRRGGDRGVPPDRVRGRADRDGGAGDAVGGRTGFDVVRVVGGKNCGLAPRSDRQHPQPDA
jgi:oleandomycin transport system ATP-binding protein